MAVVATGTPGGATVLAVASGAQFGLRRSLPLLLGMALTVGGLCAASVLGLGTVVRDKPEVAFVLRLAGSVYFLWLAWRIFSAAPTTASSASSANPVSFRGGMALILLNPKAWAIAMSSAAAFSGMGDAIGRALLIGGIFGITGTASLCLWCSFGLMLAKVLHTPRQWRAANASLAFLLAASVTLLWI